MSVKFKLDTGTETNVLSLRVFESMKRKARSERRAHLKLQPTKTVLETWRNETEARRGSHTQMLHTQSIGVV